MKIAIGTLAIFLCGAPPLPPLQCHHSGECLCEGHACHWILTCTEGNRIAPSRGDPLPLLPR